MKGVDGKFVHFSEINLEMLRQILVVSLKFGLNNITKIFNEELKLANILNFQDVNVFFNSIYFLAG